MTPPNPTFKSQPKLWIFFFINFFLIFKGINQTSEIANMNSFTIRCNNSRIDNIIKRLDINNDNFLSIDEFIDGCLSDEMVKEVLINPLFNDQL